MFVCLLHARSLFWCNTKSKNVKKTAKREKKQIFFDVFASALLKRGKIWAPKIATKGHTGDQRTRRRPKDRTDTSRISLFFSLFFSLSLFCVAYASSIHSSSSRKKRRCRITRPKKARRILPPSRFSRFALSRWWCCFIRASERTKKARIIRSGRKKNKQTKDARETKNLKKCHTWHFSARKERQR